MPRIIITPQSVLGYEDFANIFTSHPTMSPGDVADDIYLRGGSGGDFLRKQWDSLRIGESPEAHFSRPDIRAAYAAAGPQRRRGLSPSVPALNSVAGGVGQPIDPFAPSWPTFETETHRNIALANGSFDPAYPNPIAKTNALALASIHQRDLDERKAYEVQMADRNGGAIPQIDYSKYMSETPVNGVPLLNSPEVLRSQLAGDQYGDVARILRGRMPRPALPKIDISRPDDRSLISGPLYSSVTDINPGGDTRYLTGREPSPRQVEQPLQPYVPSGGGSILDIVGGATLDREIYDDPEFQKVLRTDPNRADFVYQRLTGRSLFGAPDKEGNRTSGDYPRTLAYRDARVKAIQGEEDSMSHARSMAQLELQKAEAERQLKIGRMPETEGRDYVAKNPDAEFDPVANEWKVWKMAEAPDSSGVTGGATRPYRQRVKASPAEAAYLDRHYTEVTGLRKPETIKFSPTETAVMTAAREDPVLAPLLQQKEKEYGHALTYKDIQLIKQMNQRKEMTEYVGGPRNYMNTAINAVRGIRGVDASGVAVDVPFNGQSNLPEENLNWWGKFLRRPSTEGGRFMDAVAPRTPEGMGFLDY